MDFSVRISRFAFLAAAALAVGVGCSKSQSAPAAEQASVTISGKVTYTRIPALMGTDGKVSGLETDRSKFQVQPARGITMRLIATQEQKDASGKTVHVWTELERTTTNSDGAYTFSAKPEIGEQAFVEVLSVSNPQALGVGAVGRYIRLLADPRGVNSPLNQADRPLYALRKGVAGKVSSTDPVPGDPVSANATVNFEVGTETRWWLVTDLRNRLTEGALEPTPSGSRILGILDSVAKFALAAGDPIPGNTLDLHYAPGRSEPQGSFVEFDTSLYPQAFDGGAPHFFGALRGAENNDDAWDEGVIFPLLARNRMYVSYSWLGRPVKFTNPEDIGNGPEFTGLTADQAFLNGAADALAASVLKTPFLADVTATGVRHRDIRDTKGAPVDEYSAPNLRALCWELVLKGNSLPSPGSKTDWEKIDSKVMLRLFNPTEPADATGNRTDLPSIWSQLASLQIDKGPSEPVELKNIFSDAVLTAIAKPFGVTWPRPVSTPVGWLNDWGTDFAPAAGTTIFSRLMNLNMTSAHRDGTGLFPGLSKGERYLAAVKCTKDQAYLVQAVPPPPAGSTLEVHVGGLVRILGPDSGTDPNDFTRRIVLSGRSDKPVTHTVAIWFKSPDKAQDYAFTFSLIPSK